jgi:hypothetical protein
MLPGFVVLVEGFGMFIVRSFASGEAFIRQFLRWEKDVGWVSVLNK